MRVFLDTNVVVSGFATRGLSADVVRLLLTAHDLLTSETVLTETRRVLEEKFGVPTEKVDEIERLLGRYHGEPIPEIDSPVTVRGPNDKPVLAAAISADAEILVTGDKNLLAGADQVEALRIMTPRSFWKSVRPPSK